MLTGMQLIFDDALQSLLLNTFSYIFSYIQYQCIVKMSDVILFALTAYV